MRQVTDTSIESFIEHKQSGKLGQQQENIIAYMKWHAPANNNMISRDLGMKISSVTARVHELREIGRLKEDSKQLCPMTQKRTKFWRCIY